MDMQEFLAEIDEYLEANVKPLEESKIEEPISLNSIQDFIKAGKIGYITKLSETGRLDGYDTISSGKGDLGGKSYGSHQLRSTSSKGLSTLQEFLKYSGYDTYFLNLEYTGKEFDQTWIKLSKDKKFCDLQDQFIHDTHFKPFCSILENYGIDVNKRSIFVKEIIYSTANQYGAGKIGKSLIEKFVPKHNLNECPDKEFIEYLTQHKIDTIPIFFKSSIAKGTNPKAFENRFLREKKIIFQYM